MSRYETTARDGCDVAYGYDRHMLYWYDVYADAEMPYGAMHLTGVALYDTLKALGVDVPEAHEEAMFLDTEF